MVHFPRLFRSNGKGKMLPLNVVLTRVVLLRLTHRATAVISSVSIRLRILCSLLEKMYQSRFSCPLRFALFRLRVPSQANLCVQRIWQLKSRRNHGKRDPHLTC